MAVTITQDQLRAALRLGDTPEEVAEAGRLLAFAITAVSRHLGASYADTPAETVNEAVVRLTAYLFDQPNAGRGDGYSNALRNSGAGRILLPWRIHRAGTTAEAVAEAQAVGTPGNPVVGVSVTGTVLTVTFADGTTQTHTLPAGGGGGGDGTDQVARAAAAQAQLTAVAAQNEADAASTAAGAASAAAAGAQATADSKDDAATWAEQGNADPIPGAKLINAPAGGGGGGGGASQNTIQRILSSDHNLGSSLAEITALTIPASQLEAGAELLLMVSAHFFLRSTSTVAGTVRIYAGGVAISQPFATQIQSGDLSQIDEQQSVGGHLLYTVPATPVDLEVYAGGSSAATIRRLENGSSFTAVSLLVPGITTTGALALVKPFARQGITTPPVPADLAPSPVAGRVLGLRTAGGQLETSWNQLSAGSPHFVLDTIPTPEQQAIGGLLPQGGVVLVRETTNHPTQLWVRISPAFALVLFHTFADPIVGPGADGRLPTAADFPGRLALAGNHFYRSENQGGADKVVTLKNWGPTRSVAAGEPVKLSQELAYVGSVANPPSGNYILDANAWDRGSQIWIINRTADDDDWQDWGGPVGFWHGHLYPDNTEARKHISAASDVGRILIIGHGSGQVARIVTAFSAATADDWQWLPIGVDLGDIATQVSNHNASTTAHADLRAAVDALTAASGITPDAAAALISAHNTSASSHPDLRSELDAKIGVKIYSATTTYTRGDIVEHTSGFYMYTSGVSRSSDHDPGEYPGYWFELNEAVAYFVMSDANYRIAARTVVVFDDTDEVFLCTTTQTTPRSKSYVRSQAGSLGGEFIQLGYATIPRDKLPAVREWTLNEEYKKGEIVDTTGQGHVHFIALVNNNSSSIQNRKQPGTPGGLGTWDQLYTVDNPPPAPGGLTQIGASSAVLVGLNGFTISTATRDAVITAFTGSTYRAIVAVIEAGPDGSGFFDRFSFSYPVVQFTQNVLYRLHRSLPNAIATGGAENDWRVNFRYGTSPALSIAPEGTFQFPAGSSIKFYGES